MRTKKDFITKVIRVEEESFAKTIDQGFKMLQGLMERNDVKVISGEGKSVRLLKGKNYSVWYDTERERYKIRIVVEPSGRGADMMATCDFEECLNYIKRREHGRE